MTLGCWGEDTAVLYIKKRGYTIIERNFRCRLGEIDIIARNQYEIVFFEVKTRQNQNYGLPCEAVNHTKIRHLKRMADWYMTIHPEADCDARIDVIEILVSDGKPYLHHIENITG